MTSVERFARWSPQLSDASARALRMVEETVEKGVRPTGSWA
jgi:hypothetical protein